MKNEAEKIDNQQGNGVLPCVVCSYPVMGDRIQLVNTHGKNNLMYGIVEGRNEIRLDNGELCYIPDWKYQLRKI